MSDTDPSSRLALVLSALTGVDGLASIAATALADPAVPHTVVAHHVHYRAHTLDAADAAAVILADHHVVTDGLVPWVDPDIPDLEVFDA